MRFSEEEISQLIKAWAAIALAFTIAGASRTGSLAFGSLQNFLTIFFISVVTVGLAFLLHEIAHKFQAQKYGCWAEFRSFDMGLMIALLGSFVGFIFAAPGAVMISGVISTSERGKIAAVGPITNIVLALLYLAVWYFVPVSGILYQIIIYGASINAGLAVFNLIPLWNLDGLKIIRWNSAIWTAMFLGSIGLLMIVR
ncbi:site-2 protease family protein [candidate division WWE3 bacterium]|uniref:Site-2 protease family protein n=1 Tax=candidate division WWE3 bacterium TaxID=2053526 RepID=A0A955RPA8_UNCKA|nr:site-2 protease family protein [candidate division WWE3 bacterium]